MSVSTYKIIPAKAKNCQRIRAINELSLPIGYSLSDWAEMVAKKNSYLVKCDETIVGYLVGDKTGTIITFAVLEDYRRLGLGKLLLKHFINQMRILKHKNLVLRVKIDNLPAIALYKSVGFIIDETLINYYHPGDAYKMIYTF
jgi:ribosomal-protein-alanine N-acetyltransferase